MYGIDLLGCIWESGSWRRRNGETDGQTAYWDDAVFEIRRK